MSGSEYACLYAGVPLVPLGIDNVLAPRTSNNLSVRLSSSATQSAMPCACLVCLGVDRTPTAAASMWCQSSSNPQHDVPRESHVTAEPANRETLPTGQL